MSQRDIEMAGGDPKVDIAPRARWTEPSIEAERQLIMDMQQAEQLHQVFEEHKLHEFGTYLDGFLEQYKAKNGEELEQQTDTMTPQQLNNYRGQLEPVMVDPSAIADIRQRLVKLDIAMKTVDPKFSVFTHEKTKRVATWLAREAGPSTPGYIASGEQQLDIGFMHKRALDVTAAAEEVVGFGLNIIAGATELSGRAVESLTGGRIGWVAPTNYIEGPDGKLYTNAGKVPGLVEIMAGAWAQATDQNVAQFVGKFNRTRELADMQLHGFDKLSRGISRVIGMGYGFGPIAGAAMGKGGTLFGDLAMKGLQRFAAGGAITGGISSRVVKLTKIMAKTAGAAVGQGSVEAMAFGRHEGYGTAFMGGMAMAPVLLAFGAMGRMTEKRMMFTRSGKRRALMPAKVAQAVSGALEGVGFGALESYQMGALWKLIQDPSEETWQTYAKNVIGFGIFKMMSGRSVVDTPKFEAEMRKQIRTEARGALSERVARAAEEGFGPREAPKEAAKKPPVEAPKEESAREKADRLEDAKIEELTREGEELLAEVKRGKETAEQKQERLEDEKIAETREKAEREAEPIDIKALREQVKKAPVDWKVLQELGEVRRARRAAPTIKEAEVLQERQREIELELDVIEAKRTPLAAARLRELEREGVLGEEAAAEAAREGLREAGEPSMGEAADPYRQIETIEGTKPVTSDDITATLEGRAGTKGIRIPFTQIRVGKIRSTAVQLAIKAGHITGKVKAGVYKVYEHLARTKKAVDTAAQVHEWAHGMQRKVHIGKGGEAFLEGTEKWLAELPAEVRSEMAKVLKDYPGWEELPPSVQAAELWSVWHTRNLHGDETLQAESPVLSKWMETWLVDQPHLMETYEVLRGQLQRWRDQGALGRTSQFVNRGQKADKAGSLRERVTVGFKEKVVDRMTEAFLDDLHLLRESMSKWLDISELKPEDLDIMTNPIRMLDTLRFTAGKQAEKMLRKSTHNMALEKTGEALQKVLNDLVEPMEGEAKLGRKEKAKKIRDFVDYIVAVRAAQMEKKGRETGSPLSDWTYAIKVLQTRHPEFRKAARRVKEWSDRLLDYVAESGAFTPEEVKYMKDFNVVWIPFSREMQGPKQQRGGRGVGEGKATKAFKGGTQRIIDPIVALENTTRMMIMKAHQYMVLKAFHTMALTGEVGGLVTIVDRSTVKSEFRIDEVWQGMKKTLRESATKEESATMEDAFGMLGELIQEAGVGDGLVSFYGQKMLPFGETGGIIAFTPNRTAAEIAKLPKHRQQEARDQNGKMQWMQLDPRAYESMMGIDLPSTPAWMDHKLARIFLQYPTRTVRFFATAADPAFAAANLIRDAMSQSVFSPSGEFEPFRGFRDIYTGMTELLKDGKYAQMLEASGASMSTMLNEGVRREMRGQAEGIIKQSVIGVRQFVDRWVDFWGKGESLLRIAEMKRVHQAAEAGGKSPIEAALMATEAAREITINFARGGTWSRAINMMVPYWNAGIQGQRKFIRSLTGAEGKTDAERANLQRTMLANGLVGITAPSLAIWALVHDEDWYKDLPEWRKRHFYNMRFFDDGPIISIPKPFELGLAFGTVPEIALDTIYEGNPVGIGKTVMQMMAPFLRGVGGFVPAFAKPGLEAQTGVDFWSGARQTPFWTEKTQIPEEQMRAGTTVMAQELFKSIKGLALMAGIDNPIELQKFLGSYTANASTTMLKLADEVLDLKDHPGISVGASPFIAFTNRFARQAPHGQSRAVDELMALAKELGQKKRGGHLSRNEAATLGRLRQAQSQMSGLRSKVDQGRISRDESNRRQFEIAERTMRRVK